MRQPLPSLLLGLAAWIGCALTADIGRAQGVLQSLRDDVRSASGDSAPQDSASDPPAKKDHDRRCEGRSEWCDDDDEDEAETSFMLGIGKLAFWAAASPVWLPRTLIDDATFAPGCFARYPYQYDLDGYLLPDAALLSEQYPELEGEGDAWLVRLRGEYGGDFDDLSRAGGQLLVDSASRWGIDTEANYLREQSLGQQHDRLWLGDANVVYRFAQSPQVQLRTGVGLNWLADEFGSDWGFNFTYGGDYFPADPWILSAEIDWGKLGCAGLFHGRTSVGVHFRRWEVYVGYDYLDVGDTQINSAVSGLRLWY